MGNHPLSVCRYMSQHWPNGQVAVIGAPLYNATVRVSRGSSAWLLTKLSFDASWVILPRG